MIHAGRAPASDRRTSTAAGRAASRRPAVAGMLAAEEADARRIARIVEPRARRQLVAIDEHPHGAWWRRAAARCRAAPPRHSAGISWRPAGQADRERLRRRRCRRADGRAAAKCRSAGRATQPARSRPPRHRARRPMAIRSGADPPTRADHAARHPAAGRRGAFRSSDRRSAATRSAAKGRHRRRSGSPAPPASRVRRRRRSTANRPD